MHWVAIPHTRLDDLLGTRDDEARATVCIDSFVRVSDAARTNSTYDGLCGGPSPRARGICAVLYGGKRGSVDSGDPLRTVTSSLVQLGFCPYLNVP